MFNFVKNQRSAVLGLLATITVVLSGMTVTAQTDKNKSEDPDKPKTNTRQKFMQGKLMITQEILRGVVLSDFDRIEKHATALNVLTLADEWTFNNTPEYVQMSEDLRRITKQLIKAGRDKDVDAAALAYQRLTLSCVECHQALRDGSK